MNPGKDETTDAEHPFSIELVSKTHLGKIEISDGPKGQVLIEGMLGRAFLVELIEGIMLQITGDYGVFRIDLEEGDLKGILTARKP